MSSFFRSVSDSDDSSSEEEEELSSDSDAGLQTKTKTKKAANSDSDDDSDDDDSDDDGKADEGPKKPSRFLKGASDSEDSDDEKTKVVKSAKSKRIDEVEGSVKAIDNASKINDWSAISNGQFSSSRASCLVLTDLAEFDKLVRLISRQANVAEAIPTGFVKMLVSLDAHLAGAQGAKKKMNATNAKALNSMKQKLKKTQRDYEELIKKFKLVRAVFPRDGR